MYFSEYGLSPTFPAECKATNKGSHTKFCYDETGGQQADFPYILFGLEVQKGDSGMEEQNIVHAKRPKSFCLT